MEMLHTYWFRQCLGFYFVSGSVLKMIYSELDSSVSGTVLKMINSEWDIFGDDIL